MTSQGSRSTNDVYVTMISDLTIKIFGAWGNTSVGDKATPLGEIIKHPKLRDLIVASVITASIAVFAMSRYGIHFFSLVEFFIC